MGKTNAELLEENAKLKEDLKTKEEKEAELTAQITDLENKDFKAVGGKVGKSISVETPDEYRKSSAARGLIMGRRPNEKTQCSIEELRSLINSNWTPTMIMDKHGMTAEDFKQLVWKLSKKELRDTPIKYSIERDRFDRGA